METVFRDYIHSDGFAMEKASVLFKRIMLGLLLLLLVLTLLLMLGRGLCSRSYLLAMAAGALWCGALFALRRRRGRLLPDVRGPGAALWVTGLCFAVNFAWVLAVRVGPFSDYEIYWQVACALADGTEIPTAWYIAMYPHILGTASFLSVFVRLFGQSVLAVSVVNVALTSLSCLLLYLLTREFASGEAALLAALLWALDPCKLMLNSLVFSEPLYTCLIMLFLWLAVRLDGRWLRGEGKLAAAPLWGMGMGLTLCAINIVRPIAAILVIALVLWLLFLRGDAVRSAVLWKRWGLALLALLCVYTLGGRLWDRHVEDTLGMEPAAVPVYNIYVGFNEQTQGQWSAEDMDLLFSYLQQGMTTSEAQNSMLPHLKERLNSGIDFGRLFCSKLTAFLGNDELGGYTYRFTRSELFYKLGMGIGNVFYYGVFFAMLVSLWRRFRSRQLGAWQLLPLFVLGLTLAHMGVEVSNRYHYSIIPIFIAFAALGFTGEGRSTA